MQGRIELKLALLFIYAALLPINNFAYEKSETNKLTIKQSDLINEIQLQGRVLPLETVDITASTNAYIEKIHVQLGEHVKTGQALIDLKSDQLEIDIRNAQEALIRSEIEYNKKESWLRSDDVFQAKQSNLKNKLSYQRALEVYNQNQKLHKQGIISQNELEQSEMYYNDAKLNLELSNRHLQQIINKGDDTQLQLHKLALDNARARLEILENIKQKLKIKSPINGVVLRASSKDSDNKNDNFGKLVATGKKVTTGENLLAIGNLAGFAVNVEANEQIVQSVHLNQQVNIAIPALKESNSFTGIITAIDAQPNNSDNKSSPPKYNIKINSTTNKNTNNIFLGMTARINFNIIERKDTILIPFASITYQGNTPYVKNWSDNSKRQVKLGRTSKDKIEVISGLSDKDIIQLHPTNIT